MNLILIEENNFIYQKHFKSVNIFTVKMLCIAIIYRHESGVFCASIFNTGVCVDIYIELYGLRNVIFIKSRSKFH